MEIERDEKCRGYWVGFEAEKHKGNMWGHDDTVFYSSKECTIGVEEFKKEGTTYNGGVSFFIGDRLIKKLSEVCKI